MKSWNRRIVLALPAASLGMVSTAQPHSITSVTSGNGSPAWQVQRLENAGPPRVAVLLKQSANGPGHLYQLTARPDRPDVPRRSGAILAHDPISITCKLILENPQKERAL